MGLKKFRVTFSEFSAEWWNWSGPSNEYSLWLSVIGRCSCQSNTNSVTEIDLENSSSKWSQHKANLVAFLRLFSLYITWSSICMQLPGCIKCIHPKLTIKHWVILVWAGIRWTQQTQHVIPNFRKKMSWKYLPWVWCFTVGVNKTAQRKRSQTISLTLLDVSEKSVKFFLQDHSVLANECKGNVSVGI